MYALGGIHKIMEPRLPKNMVDVTVRWKKTVKMLHHLIRMNLNTVLHN